MSKRIVTLPGAGRGPEIMPAAIEVLNAVGADFEYEEHLFGGASIDAYGTALTDETTDACKAADAVLLAGRGGPQRGSRGPPGGRRGPKRGYPRSIQASSRAGAAGTAQEPRAVRQPPSGQTVAGAV